MEIIKTIFGAVLITAIGGTLALATNFLNLKDRYKKYKSTKSKEKHKKEFIENNPDFKFTLNCSSNPPFGECHISASIVNLSNEIKYIEWVWFNFEDTKKPGKFEPSVSFHHNKLPDKWPKRLEHGERIYISENFTIHLKNRAFDYWKKGFVVYCATLTTTGVHLRSSSIDFDKLMSFLEPIKEDYKNLSKALSDKTGGSFRDIEISLWQLQLFKRLTIHIVKQLHYNKIPIVKYLVITHQMELPVQVEKVWQVWYSELEKKQIQPQIVENYLKSLL